MVWNNFGSLLPVGQSVSSALRKLSPVSILPVLVSCLLSPISCPLQGLSSSSGCTDLVAKMFTVRENTYISIIHPELPKEEESAGLWVRFQTALDILTPIIMDQPVIFCENSPILNIFYHCIVLVL